MKKKLYISILIVLLPSIIYLIVFYMNDPHGYFGSNLGSSDTTLIDNMLDWKNGAYDAVIIGDSRMTSFDDEYIEKLDEQTGLKYKNMAYGGAMGTEMNYLTRWCLEQKSGNVKSVIIVTEWYNFNKLLQQNRVESTEKIIDNPFTYAFSIDNMQDMISNIRKLGEDDNNVEEEVSAEQKEENLSTARKSMGNYLYSYETDESVMDEMISICKYCTENGIEIKIICPPWMDRFYDMLPEYGNYDMDEYKATISEYADIYDFEYEGCPLNARFDDFSDYSHFHNQTYSEFTDELIYGRITYSRLWRNGDVVN